MQITIEELKSKQRKLELDITQLVETFNKETGLTIDSLEVDYHQYTVGKRLHYIYSTITIKRN